MSSSVSDVTVFQTRKYFENCTFCSDDCLLADILASHRHPLIITVLTGNYRSSLITLELIIGSVFVILAVLLSIQMVVFCFLPGLSGFISILKHLRLF